MLSDEERLTVVNVVASTRVAEELDLPDIAIQLNCEYEPEQFPVKFTGWWIQNWQYLCSDLAELFARAVRTNRTSRRVSRE